MNKNIKYIYYFFFIAILTSCSTAEETPIIPTGVTKSYDLLNTNSSDLNGEVTFKENTNGSTTITVILNNTVDGINNAVKLRRNTANIGGGIVVHLNDIDATTGKSETTLAKLDNGEAISYDELSEFLGYLSIEGKDFNTGEFYAYADLGPNVLTGAKTVYNLFSPDLSINGLAVFEERKKGTAALTVNIFEINDNTELPTSLYIIQDSNPQEIIHPLNTIKSRHNGYSFNETSHLNGDSIQYNDFLKLNGYIQITDSNNKLNILSKGVIGTNENTSAN